MTANKKITRKDLPADIAALVNRSEALDSELQPHPVRDYLETFASTGDASTAAAVADLAPRGDAADREGPSGNGADPPGVEPVDGDGAGNADALADFLAVEPAETADGPAGGDRAPDTPAVEPGPSTINTAAPLADVETFVDALYAHAPIGDDLNGATIGVNVCPAGSDGKPARGRWCDSRTGIVEAVGAAMPSPFIQVQPAYEPANGKGRTNDKVAMVVAIPFDLDAKNVGPSRQDAERFLAKHFGRQVTLLTGTGTGHHAYLVLDEPVGPAEGKALLGRAKKFAKAIGLDGIYDPARVLRPPAGKNFKYDPPAPVELCWADGPDWSAGEIGELFDTNGSEAPRPSVPPADEPGGPVEATRAERKVWAQIHSPATFGELDASPAPFVETAEAEFRAAVAAGEGRHPEAARLLGAAANMARDGALSWTPFVEKLTGWWHEEVDDPERTNEVADIAEAFAGMQVVEHRQRGPGRVYCDEVAFDRRLFAPQVEGQRAWCAAAAACDGALFAESVDGTGEATMTADGAQGAAEGVSADMVDPNASPTAVDVLGPLPGGKELPAVLRAMSADRLTAIADAQKQNRADRQHVGHAVSDLPQPAMILDGILHKGLIVAVVAPPKVGKTMLVQDMAFCVEGGHRFHGRETKAGGVLFVEAEGPAVLGPRLKALEEIHGVTRDPTGMTFHVWPVDMSNPVQAQAIGVQALYVGASLVVIDTLNLNMGGDENSSVDMFKFISHVKNIIEISGACVLIIHHTGKDTAKGLRGHSSLIGAVDTLVEVDGTPEGRVITMKVAVQRHAASYPPLTMAFEKVSAPGGGAYLRSTAIKPKALSDPQQWVFDAIEDLGTSEPASVIRSAADDLSRVDTGKAVPRSTFLRVLNELVDMRRVEQVGTTYPAEYRVVEAGDITGG